MIDWLVVFALRKRLVAAMICVFAAIYGYYCWTQLSIEAYPDVADTSSQVVTQAPGLAAEEVEQQVTIPLERELNGTPGLAMMRSRSTFGLSLITLIFRDGIEDYWSRQRITERIQGVTLPPGLRPGSTRCPRRPVRFSITRLSPTPRTSANFPKFNIGQ